jgi:hypothetical protein
LFCGTNQLLLIACQHQRSIIGYAKRFLDQCFAKRQSTARSLERSLSGGGARRATNVNVYRTFGFYLFLSLTLYVRPKELGKHSGNRAKPAAYQCAWRAKHRSGHGAQSRAAQRGTKLRHLTGNGLRNVRNSSANSGKQPLLFVCADYPFKRRAFAILFGDRFGSFNTCFGGFFWATKNRLSASKGRGSKLAGTSSDLAQNGGLRRSGNNPLILRLLSL